MLKISLETYNNIKIKQKKSSHLFLLGSSGFPLLFVSSTKGGIKIFKMAFYSIFWQKVKIKKEKKKKKNQV